MKKQLISILCSTVLGTLVFAKFREKRSYRSFLFEQYLRLTRVRKPFESVENAKEAIEEMKDITAGKYSGTTYEFKHSVTIKDDSGSIVYIINDHQDITQQTILYIHGGAWFQDPLEQHFDFIDTLAGRLNAKVVMPVYPKVPHRDYRTTFSLLYRLYDKLLTTVKNPEQLILMGDSAGGQIALSFAQYLKEETTYAQPGHIILISPVLDGTFSNPDTQKYEKVDPMVAIDGTKYFIKLWEGKTAIKDYKISPINGTLQGLGKISIFIGTKETLYPDALRLSKLLNQQGILHDFYPGYNLFHIYPIFPIPEREKFFAQVITIIK